MSKLPLLSGLELCKILSKLGFEEIRQRGSHKYFKHPDGRVTVVPIPSGRCVIPKLGHTPKLKRN